MNSPSLELWAATNYKYVLLNQSVRKLFAGVRRPHLKIRAPCHFTLSIRNPAVRVVRRMINNWHCYWDAKSGRSKISTKCSTASPSSSRTRQYGARTMQKVKAIEVGRISASATSLDSHMPSTGLRLTTRLRSILAMLQDLAETPLYPLLSSKQFMTSVRPVIVIRITLTSLCMKGRGISVHPTIPATGVPVIIHSYLTKGKPSSSNRLTVLESQNQQLPLQISSYFWTCT